MKGGARVRARVLAIGAMVAASGGCGDDPEIDAGRLAGLEVPTEAQRGAGLYAVNCAACHGELGLGTPTGPPLLHNVYRPAHHGDEAFQLAVARGVRAHHWRFGDMPAVPGLTRDDVAEITAWIRWLQRHAGVE